MKKLLIDYHSSGTKVGIVEGDVLTDFSVEKENKSKLVGNIYKGKVANVLPGMQAIFVDIGLQRNAFLYQGDTISEEVKEDTAFVYSKLKPGDAVLCQVTKDEFGSKGARLTMNLTLAGRVVVLMPMIDYIGFSKKIDNEERKIEIECIINAVRGDIKCGFIVRTEAEQADDSEIESEVKLLLNNLKKINRGFLEKPHMSLLHKEEDLVIRAVRDIYTKDIEKIVINDKEGMDKIVEVFPFFKEKDIITLVDFSESVFHKFGLTPQIENLTKRKVVLSNGSYLIIDRAEALTVIDINTGKFVGEKNLEETVFLTNKLAVKEIAIQLKLRNIGGIVIIDFIDMIEEQHRELLMQEIEKEFSKDRVRISVVGMTKLGLVEITRKKSRSMIDTIMLQPCPYCKADGYILSDEYIISKIREDLIYRFKHNVDLTTVKLSVHPNISVKLFASKFFEKECKTIWGNKLVYVVPNKSIHIQKYEIECLWSTVKELPDDARLLW